METNREINDGLVFSYNKDLGHCCTWKYCKRIPIPNYTLQELKEKIGHDFNLID